MKKAVTFLLFAAMFAALLSACNGEEAIPPDISAEAIVGELTKPEYRGRLAGAEGNEKAGEYLIRVFEGIGLDPWDGDFYKQAFTDMIVDPNFSDPEVTLHFSDGSERKLVFGSEFSMDVGQEEMDMRRAVTRDIQTPGIEDMVYISETLDASFYQTLRNSGVTFYITPRAEKDFVYVPNLTLNTPPHFLTVDPSVLAELDMEELAEISVKNTAQAAEKELFNVVGRIPGKRSDQAVVVTAHFDAAGYNGDIYSPGAVDNASGVAAMIRAAALLLEGEQPETDIVVCAVNSEEVGFGGSKALAAEMTERYEVLYNFNIDCVGMKDGSYAPGFSTEKRSRYLAELYERHGFPYTPNVKMPGDHDSFEAIGIPAVCMAQDFDAKPYEDAYHSANDTGEFLDYALIERIAELAAEFIRTVEEEAEEAPEPNLPDDPQNFTDEQMQQMLERIKEASELADTILTENDLAFDEIFAADFYGDTIIVCNNAPIPYQDALIYKPDLQFRESIGDFELDMASLYAGYKNRQRVSTLMGQPEFPLNTKQKIDFQRLSGAAFIYRSKTDESRYAEIEATTVFSLQTFEDELRFKTPESIGIAGFDDHYIESNGAIYYCDDNLMITLRVYDAFGYDEEYGNHRTISLTNEEIREWLELLDMSGNLEHYQSLFDL